MVLFVHIPPTPMCITQVGELWYAVQPYGGWKNLPACIRRPEFEVRKRRPGSQVLLRGRQDGSLPSAHTLWTGVSQFRLKSFKPAFLWEVKFIFSALLCVVSVSV